MALVYVEAQGPWGPVRIKATANLDTLVCQAASKPVHVEDVGALDPERVAAAAQALLKPAGVEDWIEDHVKTAVKAVSEAKGRVSVMPVWADKVDVQSIRGHMGMTQAAFAKAFGFPIATLQEWEQGQSRPEGAALVLLRVIDRRPNAVREALQGT